MIEVNAKNTEVWIARDKDGRLCIYDHEPMRAKSVFALRNGRYTTLPGSWFKEVTWENSPVKVEIKSK